MQMRIQIKYLFIGIINTTFGYLLGLILENKLKKNLDLILILIISNFISISFAFLMYKLILFKNKAKIISEYIKFFLSYICVSVAGIYFTILFINIFLIDFWKSSIISLIICIILNYILNFKFNFKK